MPVSMTPHKASHELLGVLSLPDLDPMLTTRIMAMIMHKRPTLKIPQIPTFWDIGICSFQISRSGRTMTVKQVDVSHKGRFEVRGSLRRTHNV